MRLTHFSIQGHALLASMDIQVREHLVIVGANDVGKTSILRLLNLLLGASVQSLYQSLSPNDIAEDAEALIVSARLEDFTEEEQAHFAFAMAVEEGEPDYLQIQLEVRLAADDEESVTVERYFPTTNSRRGPTREQLSVIGWRYLPANRSGNADFIDGRHSPFRAMLGAVDIKDDAENLGDLLDQFNESLEQNPALAELREEIASHLSRAVPRAYDEDSLVIRTTADPRDEPLRDVSLFLRDGDRLKALAEQSDGMRQLMALTFFDLAQSNANIVAVDEPEIHLHASSQRTVASLFVESPRQRLVVTHSPYIVQRFEPKHVVVLDPERRAKQIAASDFTDVQKEQAQWWSPELLEGLTARRILFVEGLADRIIVEAAAKAVDVSLDRLGVTVFALDGADKFAHVMRIVGTKGFGLPICGLCDEDREDSWAEKLKLKPKRLAEYGFFIARKDLEHEYVRALGVEAVATVLEENKLARRSGIKQFAQVASFDDVTDEMLGDFLVKGDARKVPAARAVAPLLTPDIVEESQALSGLLNYIRDTM